MKSKFVVVAVFILSFFYMTTAVCPKNGEKGDSRLTVLVLLGEWFGDTYFPLKKEIDRRGWTMKRIGVEPEYRGCYNKARDVVLTSDILIPDLKDFSPYDCLIIPSGPQWRKFNQNPVVIQFLKDAHASGLLIASFCVGNKTVRASGLLGSPEGQTPYPERVTLVRDGILMGPRGGGPPPGDGFKSAPIKEICDAIEVHAVKARSVNYLPELKGPYLGQNPPGKIPEIFAPGIVSKKNRYELMTAFSPDGGEFCFTVTKRKWSEFRIWSSKCDAGKWSDFQILPVSRSMSTFGPVYSPSGDRLYFSSPDWYTTPTNIFFCLRTKTGWSKSKRLGAPINSEYNEWQFSIAKDKTMLFTSNRPGGEGDYDLYISEMVKHKYENPVNLRNLNSDEDEYSAFLTPDKNYIIYSSQRKGGYGWDDLYISFKQADNSWTNPVGFGPAINTEHAEFAPHLSPDGKYLFFSRWDKNSNWSDIYWVDAGIIQQMKPQDLKSEIGGKT